MDYSHIIHLADIHIRTGNRKDSRYDEYQQVFKTFLNEVSQLPFIKTTLFVICGDIFHNKSRLDAYSLLLWTELLQGLTKLGTVVIICGNHDYRQESSDIPDLIQAVYALGEHHYPCYYLDKSGTYTFNNIEFGLVCIKDTLNSYSTSGLVEELPPFPQPTTNKIPIALFHGTITQSALPNGQLIPAGKGYPLEWFKGYSYVLLGDNHKQQVHTTDTMIWGYPGSLIQQDMGEPVYGHGYILWDLQNKTATPHHIYNEYGRMKTKIHNDKVYVRTDHQRFVPLDEKAYLPWFPKKPILTILGNIGDEYKVQTTFHEANIVPTEFYTTLSLQTPTLEQEDTFYEISHLNHPTKWLEYVRIKDESLANQLELNNWMFHPEHILMDPIPKDSSQELQQQIHKTRTKLQDMIEIYKRDDAQRVTLSKITLKHMTWSWTFSYGQNNWFNFEIMEGKIAILNGPNASGKSAFIDALCIGLFGEPNPNRRMHSTKKMTNHFIHNQRPSGKASEAMFVSILFELNKTLYEITRKYAVQSEKDESKNLLTELYTIDKETNERNLKCSGSLLVNEWIRENCGSIEDLMKTSIVSQMDNHNFFFAKADEQKKIIDHAVNLNTLQKFSELIHEALLGYNTNLKILTTLLTAQKETTIPTISEAEYTAYQEEAIKLQERIQTLEAERDHLIGQASLYLQTPPPKPLEYYQNHLKPISQDKTPLKERISIITHWMKENPQTTLREEANLKQLYENVLQKRSKLQSKQFSSTRPLQTIEEQLSKVNQWFEEHSKWNRQDIELHTRLKQEYQQDYLQWKQESIPKPKHNLQVPNKDWKTSVQTYKELQNKYTSLEHTIEKHQLSKPSPLRLKEDEAKWNKEFQAYKNAQLKCQQNEWTDLEECKRNLQDTERYIQQYQKNLQELHHTEQAYSRTEKELQEDPHWEEEYKLWKKQTDDTPKQIEDLEKQHKEYIRLREIKRLLEQGAKDYQEWIYTTSLAKKNKWTSPKQLQDKLKLLEEQYVEGRLWSAELKRLEEESQEHYPFNPECSACRSNPLHLRCEKAKEKIKELQEKILSLGDLEKRIKHYKKGIEITTYLHQVQSRMEQYTQLQEEAQQYKDEDVSEQLNKLQSLQQNYTLYQRRFDKLRYLSQEHSQMKVQLKKLRKKMTQLQTEQEFNETLQYWKDAVDTLSFVEQQKSYMEKEQQTWKKSKQEWEKLELWTKQMNEYTKECSNLQEKLEKAHSEAYVSWKEAEHKYDKLCTDYESLDKFLSSVDEKESLRTALQAEVHQNKTYTEWQQKLNSYNEQIKSIEYSLHHQELEHIKQQLQEIEENESMQQAIAWYQYNEVKTTLQSLQSRWVKVNSLLDQYKHYQTHSSQQQKSQGLYEILFKEWTERRDILIKLDELLVGERGKTTSNNTYKEWIYSNHVIPMIERYVNQFLSEIDNIRFRIEYNAKHLMYYVQDRGNETSFAASSGYQQFVIGLAMRQALAIIGGSGNNLQHMIIDEGFTACDQRNLEKANDVLKLLIQRGQYKSILIVSHLESIKDVVPLKINIERKDAFSYLRYGTPYPSYKQISRGRKK